VVEEFKRNVAYPQGMGKALRGFDKKGIAVTHCKWVLIKRGYISIVTGVFNKHEDLGFCVLGFGVLDWGLGFRFWG